MHNFLATVAAKKKEFCDVDSLLTAFSKLRFDYFTTRRITDALDDTCGLDSRS